MIGLCGAHRTGKTTLAMKFGEKYRTNVVQIGASGTFARLGLDPKVDYPLKMRLDIQYHILQDAMTIWSKAVEEDPNGLFISDRTPIDMMAYTIADYKRETDPSLDEFLRSYTDLCFSAISRYFVCLINVPPGIQVVEEAGKAPGTYGYVEHIQTLVRGLMSDERVECARLYIPRRTIDLDTRVMAVAGAWQKTQSMFAGELKAAKQAAVVFH